MDYSTLSLSEVRTGLDAIGRETLATFGGLDARRLNWRADATEWSVAQCFDHLVTANHLMFQAAEAAMNGTAPRTIWQRIPMFPAVVGRALVRSQAPGTPRRFKAPRQAQPATSDIAADIIQRFVEQHRDAAARLQSLDERKASQVIMTSPFTTLITYSVLDGWRLVYAHDRRHFEQARRVTLSSEFHRLQSGGSSRS